MVITNNADMFSVRYNAVFDAFKIAATEVASSLGADVAQISGILDGFKNKYNKNLSESQQVITTHLERVASGENLTAEDWEKYNNEMAYIRDTEAVTSDAAREYAKIQENLNALDFGVNTEEAMAELQRLAEYANKYRDELTNAQKTLDEDYAAFKRIADNDLAYGKIDKNQYKEVIAGLEAAQALTYQSYLDKYNEFQKDIAEISERAATQINFTKEGALSNVGGFEDWWASFQATWGTGLGLWGDRQEAYEQALFGDVYKMGEEVNNIITQTELEPYILNIALSDEAKALLGDLGINGFNYGGSYSATHIKKSGNSFKNSGRQRGYASGTSSAEQGLKLVGERGPEIIDFGGGERVYNAYETRRILNPVTAAPPSVSSTVLNSGGITLKIENNPVIHTSGGTENLDEVLQRNNEHLIVIVDKYLREKADNARRMDYD